MLSSEKISPPTTAAIPGGQQDTALAHILPAASDTDISSLSENAASRMLIAFSRGEKLFIFGVGTNILGCGRFDITLPMYVISSAESPVSISTM